MEVSYPSSLTRFAPERKTETIPAAEEGQRRSAGAGPAGFVTSLVGLLFCCGFLSPIGFLFSVFALMKPPRGMAIAGTVLGAIGSLWLLIGGFAMVLGFFGIGAAGGAVKNVAKRAITDQAMMNASTAIRDYHAVKGALPATSKGKHSWVTSWMVSAPDCGIVVHPIRFLRSGVPAKTV
jgi:hypothetical protein